MTDWHADPDFWERVAPLLFDEKRLQQTPDEVDDLLNLLGLTPGAAIFDQACGIGRHAIELAARRYNVTGVDRFPLLLERAREAAEASRLDVEWIEADMREFSRADSFDGAINLFSSFGYFADPEDDRRVARNLYASLRPGGAALIDTMGREIVARDFVGRDWRRIDGIMLIEDRHVEQDWSWIRNDWTVIDGEERFECTWGIRLYSGTELRRLLMEEGFETVDLFGNLAGDSYDSDADRLVAVARKQG